MYHSLEARAQSINRRAQADNIAITASKEAEWTEGNLLSSSTMFKFTEIARRLTTHESLKVVDEAYSNEAIKEKDLRQDYRQHFVTTAPVILMPFCSRTHFMLIVALRSNNTLEAIVLDSMKNYNPSARAKKIHNLATNVGQAIGVRMNVNFPTCAQQKSTSNSCDSMSAGG